MSSLGKRRWAALIALTILCLGIAGIGLWRAISDEQERRQPTEATELDRALELGDVLAEPHITFRSTAPGPTYGLVAAVPLSEPGGPRAVSTLACERVYTVGAAGGVCLSADRGAVTTYRADVLDDELRPVRELKLNGIPSRTRMSDDGGLAATTTFVSGHSYLESGFSTETLISDARTGRSFGNLENYRTTLDGKVTKAVDLNIWGVTFAPGADPNRFYATAATGGRTWLVEGDLAARTLTSLRQDAECPSLSPDGRTVVYKKRAGNKITWRLHALDVSQRLPGGSGEVGEEWALPEERSVDDQVEWLDSDRVVYGLYQGGTATADVWVSPLRGGEPTTLIPNAWSPAVVRQ